MKKVIIPESGLYKCVLLTDGKTTVFRAGDGEFHMDVAGRFRKKETGLKDFRIAGGGRINIKSKSYDFDTEKWVTSNECKVYGYSVDYGHMDKNVVEQLISDYCNENGLEFINECGQGY